MATEDNEITSKPREACDAILSEYAEGLKTGGKPFLLEEEHKKLRDMAFGNLRRVWRKLMVQEKAKGSIPMTVWKIFDGLMAEPRLPYQLISRVSGLGSRGRYRVVAIADWRGGKLTRR